MLSDPEAEFSAFAGETKVLLERMLTDSEWDLEALNSAGETCTYIAIVCFNSEALCLFLNASADVDSVVCGQPLLETAFQSTNHCLLMLLGAGAVVRNLLHCWLNLQIRAASLCRPGIAIGKRDWLRLIARTRLDFVRQRALQVCVGLQSLRLDALQMCEILQRSCGHVARLIPFHLWWKIATTVKHFIQKRKRRKRRPNED
jgi:hypothetical protein